jgi:pSer/pThr/pTyr-binding forkhead associated (FHA) protein
MWKLCIEDDEGGQTVVPIIRDEITIGRQEGNTIRLTERNVSRRHAKLVRRDGRLYLEEIEARYGIRKNGSKIDQTEEFTEGDVFVIGDYRLTLQTERPKGAPAPAAAASSRPPVPKAPPGTTRNRSNEGTEVLPAMPAKLVIISSNFAGQEFPLARKEMLIGRGDECDIIIDHRSVSTTHAKITRDGSTYQIVDLNSKNGLRIGGERYTNVPLKRGDVVELGHVKFRFVEPGENYIFTPQSADFGPPSEDAYAAPKKGPNVPVIAGIAVVVALLAGAAIWALSGGGGEAVEETNGAAIADATAGSDTTSGLAAEPDEAEDPKVDQGIEEASDLYEAGDIEKAIGALDGLSKYSKPSARQKREIGDLTSKAKLERPFRKHYIATKADVEKEDWEGAYQSWSEIPKHSIFKGITKKEGLPSVISAGLMALAQTALEEDDGERAESLASDAASINPDVDGAAEVLAEVKRRQTTVAKVRTPKASGDDSPRKTRPKKRTEPVFEPKLTRDEAKKLASDAQRKLVIQGDASGAISMCKEALSAKEYSCYRVMGMAYKQRGDVNAACKNFKKALRYDPPALQAKIKMNMESLGCP